MAETGTSELKPQGRWDKHNRPIGYIIGVTPGFASFRQGEERMTLSGITRKIMFGARQGFDFVEVDFESIAEAYEHGLAEQVKRVVETQGPNFGFGIHGPVTGRIALDLGVANASDWEMHHRNLQRTALAAKKTGAKFILFHTSHNPRPGIVYYLRTHEYRVPQYSFTGQNLAEWMKQVDDGKFVDPGTGKKVNLGDFKLVDWFKARFIRVLFNMMGLAGEPSVISLMATGIIEEANGDVKKIYDEASFKECFEYVSKKLEEITLEKWPETRAMALKEITERIARVNEEMERLEKELLPLELLKRGAEVREKRDSMAHQIARMREELEALWRSIAMLRKEGNESAAAELESRAKQLEDRIKTLTEEFRELDQELKDIETAKAKRIAAEKKPYYDSLIREKENLLIWEYRIKNCEHKYENIEELIYTIPIVRRNFNRVLNDGQDPREDPTHLSPLYKEFQLYQSVYEYLQRFDFDKVFLFWKEQGSEAEENVSYQVIAKYMSKTRDFLWKEIVEKEAGCVVDPDKAIDLANRGDEVYPGAKIPVTKIIELIITAVACKYIQGHLLVKSEQWNMGSLPELSYETRDGGKRVLKEISEKEAKMSVYEFCKENKIHIFVETEQPSEGLEGKLRIMHAHHHVALVKSIENGEYISYTMDFEHLTTNLIDPIEDVVSNLGKGDGKYVRMLHVNAPKPYGGLHGQIQLFSLDMYVLYKWMWELRQKGMKNAYMIWEWGAAGPPEESAPALRKMIRMLEKDVPPDKLPPEFYGMGPEFEAQQYQAIFMHAMDPIEGLITFPEHTYSFFGERAKTMGRLSQWLRNRFR